MEGIKVFIRIRPLGLDRQGEKQVANMSSSNKEISVNATLRHVRCRYDYVFNQSSTQAQVYDKVKSSVKVLFQGINATIFAYGQTSSGKTHTLFGRKSSIRQDPGIVPRCIKDIFGSPLIRHCQTFSVFASFIQVYNDQIFDMLDDPDRKKPLSIHEMSTITVSGLTEYKVHSCDQCLALVELGLKNRAIRETSMNDASSRSHSILQIIVEQTRIDQSSGMTQTLHSKLNLVDLAGSERWTINSDISREFGDGQISELTNINSSLYTLGRCIAALAKQSQMENSKKARRLVHIPYRDSKLTRILQDSLGGNTKTYLVATVNPSAECADESISTLRFADRAHQVMTFAQVNQEMTQVGESEDIKAMKIEILRLKNLLHTHGIASTLNDSQSNCMPDKKVNIESQHREIHANETPDGHSPASNDSHMNLLHELKRNNDEIETIRSNVKPIYQTKEVLDTSRSKLKLLTCEKIASALGTVLVSVDSFLNTLNLYQRPKEIEKECSSAIEYIPSQDAVVVDRIKEVCGTIDHIDDNFKAIIAYNNDLIPEKINTLQLSNIDPKLDSTMCNEVSKSTRIKGQTSLTYLLKQRKQLRGNLRDSVDNNNDFELKDELKKAKKKKKQNLQLHQWLLDKEKNAENPFQSFY